MRHPAAPAVVLYSGEKGCLWEEDAQNAVFMTKNFDLEDAPTAKGAPILLLTKAFVYIRMQNLHIL